MNPRETILGLFNGERPASIPAFSGLTHVTAAGLEREGLSFHEVHRDADKLARAAASTFRLTGLPSAALPLDICVEAEALGAEVDFREHGRYEFPRVAKPLFNSVEQFTTEITENTEILKWGRISLVCEAITKVKADIGAEAVIGGILPGPFTLLLFLVESGALFTEMKRIPQTVLHALFHLSSFLSQVGHAYRSAGADFLTIHDMGGSPGFLGPKRFADFVLPAQQHLIAALPAPRVLSVCGKTDGVMHLLAQSGAEAISVDQTNHLSASRAALPRTLLFGNLDPVETLSRGDQAQVQAAAEGVRAVGVDALWPGCDLYPPTPLENLRALNPPAAF
jgi:[methyl-Co(III) methanol-specific corrinoid protein]:coenzyme M methyltransferase